jgi:S1-C subfamily serine protease
MVTLDPKIIQHERMQNPNFPPIEQGVLVVRVVDGSPAATGGLQTGDIVISFDGKRVRTSRDMLDQMGFEIGKTMSLKVLRDGTEMTFTIVSAANRAN